MTTLFFSNADYYKNDQFQKLMRAWNVLDDFKHFDEPKIYEQVEENLMNEFYRESKEWLFSLDEDKFPNITSKSWKKGLE